MNADETYMTITAAAQYMGLSRPCVYRLERQGKLTISRLIPDAPRVRRRDLDALLAEAFAPAGEADDTRLAGIIANP